MSTIRYISLFSGIEAATVAWHQLGWKPIAYAEIEPFPQSRAQTALSGSARFRRYDQS